MNFVAAEAMSTLGRDAVVNPPGGHELKLTMQHGLAQPDNVEVGIRPEHRQAQRSRVHPFSQDATV